MLNEYGYSSNEGRDPYGWRKAWLKAGHVYHLWEGRGLESQHHLSWHHLIIKEKLHPCFHRENDNLFFVISISLSKALTHYSVEVKTLDDCSTSPPVTLSTPRTTRRCQVRGCCCQRTPWRRGMSSFSAPASSLPVSHPSRRRCYARHCWPGSGGLGPEQGRWRLAGPQLSLRCAVEPAHGIDMTWGWDGILMELLNWHNEVFVVVQSLSHVWLCDPMDCSMPLCPFIFKEIKCFFFLLKKNAVTQTD